MPICLDGPGKVAGTGNQMRKGHEHHKQQDTTGIQSGVCLILRAASARLAGIPASSQRRGLVVHVQIDCGQVQAEHHLTMADSGLHARLDVHNVTAALSLLQAAEARPSSCLSARDGALLRLVPVKECLTTEQLQLYLKAAANKHGYFANILHNALQDDRWYRSSSQKRCLAAFVRSLVYLQAGNTRQASADAAVATSYAPKRKNAGPAEDLQQLATSCGWAPALWASAEALHCLQQDVEAALHVLLAVSLEPTSSHLQQRCTQLLSHLPADLQVKLDSLHLMRTCSTGITSTVFNADNHAAAETADASVPSTAHALNVNTADMATAKHKESIASEISHQSTAKPQGCVMKTSAGVSAEHLKQAATKAVKILSAWLQKKRMMATPELFRPKEKYHYYKQWMRGRVLAALGLPSETDGNTAHNLTNHHQDYGHDDDISSRDATQKQLMSWSGNSTATPHDLPEVVVKKMVDGLMADDLDLLLKHPVAVKAQVVELLSVWHCDGDQGLQQYHIEPPSWEEVQMLSGPGCVGLPLGSNGGLAHTSTASALPQNDALNLLTGPMGPLSGTREPEHALLAFDNGTADSKAVLPAQPSAPSADGAAVVQQLYAVTECLREKWGASEKPTRARILHSLLAKSM